MTRSKTTESRNSYKGVRKLSKKASKKGSNKGSRKKKNNNNTTEEMLNILSSDENVYTGRKVLNNTQDNNVDPYMIQDNVPTDQQGNRNHINSIGSLLGGIAQLNTNTQYVPPDLSSIQNKLASTMMPQQMIDQDMPQMMSQMPQMMGQMPQMMGQMPQQMMGQMPQQMMGQMPQQMMGGQDMPEMPQQMQQQMLKNIASLNTVQRLV